MGFLSKRRLEKCPKGEDLINYWPMLIEGMRFSTKEFYDRTEAALQARSIPELEVSRIDIHEGGPMTPRREYLRLRRERLVFDICAMPFGSGFYVSEWFWRQPHRMGLVAVGILVAMGWLVASIAQGPSNFTWIVICILLAALIASVLWFGEAMDGMMMRVPLFGQIYERYLRRITYYREDRTNAFRAAAHSALCNVIDEICQTQGIAPLGDAAKRPMHTEIKPDVGPLRHKPTGQPVG